MINFFIVSYLLSFMSNILISIKYPDGTIESYHIFFSLLFLTALFFSLKKESEENSSIKPIKYFLIAGFVSSLIVFVVNRLEISFAGNFLFDFFSLIHYFLYGLLITPLFGFNYFLELDYGLFSLLTSVFYFILYVIYLTFAESNKDEK